MDYQFRQERERKVFVFQNDVGNKREEWMTELPSAQAANLGLGPRKFRLRDGPDMSDRSCWTDTPTQKAQKQMDLVNIKKYVFMHLYFKLQMRGIPLVLLLGLQNFIYVLMLCLSRSFQEAKKLRDSEKKHVNEFHKKETDKSEKREKSLLEVHQSKIAKKKKVT